MAIAVGIGELTKALHGQGSPPAGIRRRSSGR